MPFQRIEKVEGKLDRLYAKSDRVRCSAAASAAKVKGWPMLLTPADLVETRQAELLGIYRDGLAAVRALDDAVARERERRRAN